MGWWVMSKILGDGRIDGWVIPLRLLWLLEHLLTKVISGTLHYWRYLDKTSSLVLPIHAHCVLRRSFTFLPGFSVVAVLYKGSAPKKRFLFRKFSLGATIKLESLLGQNAKWKSAADLRNHILMETEMEKPNSALLNGSSSWKKLSGGVKVTSALKHGTKVRRQTWNLSLAPLAVLVQNVCDLE